MNKIFLDARNRRGKVFSRTAKTPKNILQKEEFFPSWTVHTGCAAGASPEKYVHISSPFAFLIHRPLLGALCQGFVSPWKCLVEFRSAHSSLFLLRLNEPNRPKPWRWWGETARFALSSVRLYLCLPHGFPWRVRLIATATTKTLNSSPVMELHIPSTLGSMGMLRMSFATQIAKTRSSREKISSSAPGSTCPSLVPRQRLHALAHCISWMRAHAGRPCLRSPTA